MVPKSVYSSVLSGIAGRIDGGAGSIGEKGYSRFDLNGSFEFRVG
jgi:hypothetical protein